jgi:hypothetical protein
LLSGFSFPAFACEIRAQTTTNTGFSKDLRQKYIAKQKASRKKEKEKAPFLAACAPRPIERR